MISQFKRLMGPRAEGTATTVAEILPLARLAVVFGDAIAALIEPSQVEKDHSHWITRHLFTTHVRRRIKHVRAGSSEVDGPEPR
jgi:hypothetical protein